MAPSTCCTCSEQPDSRDACMCGCGYLNGPGPVLVTQMMALVGFFFSFAALGDCSFVELQERLFLPDGPDLPIEVTQTQYIGLLTWQRLDSTCYWYNEGSNPEDQVQRYFDLLGMDWRTARVFGAVSVSCSFFFFCYLLSFICSTQVRGVRYFNVFFTLTLCCFQGLTFFVFRSDICEENGCIFSRGAGFSVAALASFLIAGISFLFTHDFPGDRFDRAKAAQVVTYSKPLPPQDYEEEVVEEEPYYDEEEIVEEEVDENCDEVVEEEIVDDDVEGGGEQSGTGEGETAASSTAPVMGSTTSGS
mmetsp:Transcript_22775/g.53975  ORF Transcript_22775/g.53975 Transcript_22775/m.53975 type:complete len:304 (+) Transcript_22775:309-1220(+)